MRKKYLDNIKWITVVLVVIYHVIYMYNGIEVYGVIGPFKPIQYQDVFQYIVYPWFMLLLFVVSGMSARFYLNKHSEKEFIKTRTKKYLVPSTIGLFVMGWMLGYYNLQISGAFKQMKSMPKLILYIIMSVSGCGVLWYIQMLWIFSVLLIFFRKIERDRIYKICKKTPIWFLIVLTMLIWAMAQILNTPIVVVYRFGIYGTGFLLGYLIFSHDEVMDRLSKYWLPFITVSCLCCFLFIYLFWGKPYAEHEVLDTFLCNLYAWIATLSILAFMKKWGEFENLFTKFMIRNSWGLYLFHYLPLAACAYYLSKFTLNLPIIIYYIAVALSAFIGAFLIYGIVSRIPIVRELI